MAFTYYVFNSYNGRIFTEKQTYLSAGAKYALKREYIIIKPSL